MKCLQRGFAVLICAGAALLFAAPAALAAPGNDNFANAAPLNCGGSCAAGSNVDATAQAAEPDHGGSPANQSVWYTWTAGFGGFATIDACATTDFFPRIAVYTGATLGGLNPEGSNGGTTDCSVDFYVNTPGTTYKIAIDSFPGEEGSFSFDVSPTQPPFNDNFANAQIIADPVIRTTDSNVGATAETGEPDHGRPGADAARQSVWYRWTPSTSGFARVGGPCNSGFYGFMGVYTGSAVNALTMVADTSTEVPEGNCQLRFQVNAGTQYRIAVDSDPPDAGGFTLDVHMENRPPNDDLADAEAVGPSLPAEADPGTIFDASPQPGEPEHAGQPAAFSVWYSWTPPAGFDGDVFATSCSNAQDAAYENRIQVFTDSNPGTPSFANLTPVADNDLVAVDGDHYNDCRALFHAVAGANYKIAIDVVGSMDTGDNDAIQFGIHEANPPANDDLADAEQLNSTLPDHVVANTVDATGQPGEPEHRVVPGSGDHIPAKQSVWYEWNSGPYNGTVKIDTCDPAPDPAIEPMIAVYEDSNPAGNSFASLTRIAGNAADRECRVNFTAEQNTDYKIAFEADLKDGGNTDFVLRAPAPPANDNFANATNLGTALPTSVAPATGNLDATAEAGEPAHAHDFDNPDYPPAISSVWFRWKAPANRLITFDTCDSDFGMDSRVAVYTAANPASPAVTGLVLAGGNDDMGDNAPDADTIGCPAYFPGPGDFIDTGNYYGAGVTIPVTQNTTYYIAVDGLSQNLNANEGHFTLRLTVPVPEPPSFTGTDPATTPGSPSTNLHPKVLGTVPDHPGPSMTTVKLYDNPSCSGSPLGSGSPLAFPTGITLSTAINATTTAIFGTAGNANGTSACSSTLPADDHATYYATLPQPPPPPPATTPTGLTAPTPLHCPKGKKLKNGRCVKKKKKKKRR